jgi:hypothetical protein
VSGVRCPLSVVRRPVSGIRCHCRRVGLKDCSRPPLEWRPRIFQQTRFVQTAPVDYFNRPTYAFSSLPDSLRPLVVRCSSFVTRRSSSSSPSSFSFSRVRILISVRSESSHSTGPSLHRSIARERKAPSILCACDLRTYVIVLLLRGL